MTRFDELPTAIVGRLGEMAAAETMRSDGASTISLCRIDSGGAPMLEQGTVRRDALVLPDLQVFNLKAIPGAFFVEIKTYERAIENRAGGFMAHGIPVRLYDHYVSNENATGIPVYLAVNELDTGELRISNVPLSQLWKDPCRCSGCRAGAAHVPGRTGIREPQWYFDRDELSIVYKHSDKTIARLRQEHARLMRSHARARHVNNAPTPKSVFEDDARADRVLASGYTRREHSGPDARVVVAVEPAFMRDLGSIGDHVVCNLDGSSFPGIIISDTLVAVERAIPASATVRLSRGSR